MTDMNATNSAPPVPAATAKALGLTRADDEIAIGYWRSHPDSDHPDARGPWRSLDRSRDKKAREWASTRAAAHASLPWPGDYCDPSMPEPERERVCAALDDAPIVARFRGCSHDRLDPDRKANGSGERARGGYRWPEGLTRYVRLYGLRLDPRFLQAIGA